MIQGETYSYVIMPSKAFTEETNLPLGRKEWAADKR
jgi:hypothetical protein